MNNEHREFLNLRRLPATLDAAQTAILLGINDANIPILVAKGFLKPLGKPVAANAPKKFSSTTIEALARDPEAMHRMRQMIGSHWRTRNGKPTRVGMSIAKPGGN